ncbi:MAG: hypothetical protein LC791_15925 [Acidobacteria bacterium]|nr:hypothetical protein [Acidobacteriota bacterium]
MTTLVVRTAAAAITLLGPAAAFAQQRPLVTEDPETVGAGRLLIEAGLDHARDVTFPVSGLEGDLLSVPTFGVSIGISSVAEIQVDGAFYRRLTIKRRFPAPLRSALEVVGDQTSAPDDVIVGTKLRALSETAGRPALGLRFATKLPNASNESGLGHDTTDFFASVLLGKTVQSIRIVGNVGVAIVGDPTTAARQDDLLTLGGSIARAITASAELVGEINTRLNLASGDATPGAENRGLLRAGARYTRGAFRIDAAALIGLTPRDPDFGLTTGFTWVIDAFQIP